FPHCRESTPGYQRRSGALISVRRRQAGGGALSALLSPPSRDAGGDPGRGRARKPAAGCAGRAKACSCRRLHGLAVLDEDCRRVFTLCELEGRTTTEVARELGI